MLIIFNQSDLYFDTNFRDAIVLAIGERRKRANKSSRRRRGRQFPRSHSLARLRMTMMRLSSSNHLAAPTTKRAWHTTKCALHGQGWLGQPRLDRQNCPNLLGIGPQPRAQMVNVLSLGMVYRKLA